MSDHDDGWPDLAAQHNAIRLRHEEPIAEMQALRSPDPSPFADPVAAIAAELLEHNVTLGGVCSCGERLWYGHRPGEEPRVLKAQHGARAIVEMLRRG